MLLVFGSLVVQLLSLFSAGGTVLFVLSSLFDFRGLEISDVRNSLADRFSFPRMSFIIVVGPHSVEVASILLPVLG